jgi:hypothetical protein
VEDRPAKLDEREVTVPTTDRANDASRFARSGRSGRFVFSVLAASIVAVALDGARPALAEEPSGAVDGRLMVHGQTFSFTRVWLVRGPETSDKTKPAAYLILSASDLSGAITDCPTIQCVLWDTVQEAAILEPLDEKAESFWLRVVSSRLSKEYQLSGRRWIGEIETRERIAGRLQFSYSNTGDEADLHIDAKLLKEFPIESSRP